MDVSFENVTRAVVVPAGFGKDSGCMLVELRCRLYMTPDEFLDKYKGAGSLEITLKDPE
jgi:hypothetical protein